MTDGNYPPPPRKTVVVSGSGLGPLAQIVEAGPHQFFADEPLGVGDDTGPNPYDLLLAALGACTAMTLRMYAAQKQWSLTDVEVTLTHNREHSADCNDCDKPTSKIDVITRVLRLEGDLDDTQRERLKEIAERCPVHRTLMAADKQINTDLI